MIPVDVMITEICHHPVDSFQPLSKPFILPTQSQVPHRPIRHELVTGVCNYCGKGVLIPAAFVKVSQ